MIVNIFKRLLGKKNHKLVFKWSKRPYIIKAGHFIWNTVGYDGHTPKPIAVKLNVARETVIFETENKLHRRGLTIMNHPRMRKWQ